MDQMAEAGRALLPFECALSLMWPWRCATDYQDGDRQQLKSWSRNLEILVSRLCGREAKLAVGSHQISRVLSRDS
jgi:hypothetical protein